MTRCLRWSSITFDIEGVGKGTLALLGSPSFPFGGKRGHREKMICKIFQTNSRGTGPTTPTPTRCFGLNQISRPRNVSVPREICCSFSCNSFFNQSRHRIYVGGKFSISYWSLKMICKIFQTRAIWSGDVFFAPAKKDSRPLGYGGRSFFSGHRKMELNSY